MQLIKFNGKNYSAWAYQFELYLKGKKLWGHISGSMKKPSEKDKLEDLEAWETKEAQIMSWMLGAVEPQFFLHLKPYKTAQDMWGYLKRIYHQENSARRFQLEHDIAQYCQGQMTVQEYYSGFFVLWTEYTDIAYATLTGETLSGIQEVHKITQRDQFLMKLRPEFETMRSNLMNRHPSPSLETCLNEVLREEQRIFTQHQLSQQSSNGPTEVAYVAKGKPPRRDTDLSKIQCFTCKEYGHYSSQCRRKVCNYCKASGHIISECRKRPENRNSRAYSAIASSDSQSVASASPSSSMSSQPSAPSPPINPEMIQQMILQAFSTLGISGKIFPSPSMWYFDSGASNHMTSTSRLMSNIQSYDGKLQVQTANGGHLPITESCFSFTWSIYKFVICWTTCR